MDPVTPKKILVRAFVAHTTNGPPKDPGVASGVIIDRALPENQDPPFLDLLTGKFEDRFGNEVKNPFSFGKRTDGGAPIVSQSIDGEDGGGPIVSQSIDGEDGGGQMTTAAIDHPEG